MSCFHVLRNQSLLAWGSRSAPRTVGYLSRGFPTARLPAPLLWHAFPSSSRASAPTPTPTPTPTAPASIPKEPPDAKFIPARFKEFNLDGKVFVVTGGGRGLGLTLAEALVEAGGQGEVGGTPVYALDRLETPSLEFHAIQQTLGAWSGGSLHYHRLDVRDTHAVEAAVADIADRHTRLDGFVAAAGVQKVTPALDYPPDAIMEMMEINFKGVYASAVACARQMIRYDCAGSVLLIASMSGVIANKGFTSSVYNASKAAVCQLARSLAMEWGKVVNGRPIRVNALCPGNIMTPMVKKNFEDDPGLRAIWERENMLGRLSEPSEYRGAALFCLSDASSFMTGSQLIIDGGYTAW